MSLSARQLTLTRGERNLLVNLDVSLEAGEALRVTGENGSGKTSLLRILAGLVQPAAGSVHWCGEDIATLREQYHAQLVYLGHAQGIKDDLLAWENLVLAARLAGHVIDAERACQALAELGLSAQAELPVRVLSQGQRKRVALARLHLGLPQRLWILDEAFTALDVASVARLTRQIGQHLAAGGMLVYTTHQEIDLPAGQGRVLDLGRSKS
jgi:heme exporter protein A